MTNFPCRLSCCFAVVLTVFLATAARGGTIAECGFNDQAGIGGNPTVGSPYQLGQPLNGQGGGESGWSSVWGTWKGGGTTNTTTVTATASAASQEGDGILQFLGSSSMEVGAYRSWNAAQTERFWLEQYIDLPANAVFQSRPGQANNVAAHWKVSGGKFLVMNGALPGQPFVDTGFQLKPNEWQQVGLWINPVSKTYEFYVDGVRFDSPSPLGFRGNPSSINYVDYLAQSSAVLDGIRVSTVPEPASLTLAAVAILLAGLAFRRRAGG